jgi:hypothetical protein
MECLNTICHKRLIPYVNRSKKKTRPYETGYTFSSLIFSCKLSLESFNFCASLRNSETTRIASFSIADLSILGVLPGSRMAPNSKNLTNEGHKFSYSYTMLKQERFNHETNAIDQQEIPLI